MRIGKRISFVSVASAFLLAGCAPPDVPRDAERHWSLKGSFHWEWSRNVEHGCVAWTAKESYAVVWMLIETHCEGASEQGFFDDEKGLQYASFSDQLLFKGYSEWKPHADRDWPEFCPYSIAQSEIDTLQLIATEVLDLELTGGERRILRRVSEQLAATDGTALRVSYLGCVDVVDNRARRESGQKIDPWTGTSQNK